METDEKIQEVVKEILTKINGGSLFGKEIDFENIDEVIVAAYYLGYTEGKEHAKKILLPAK